MNLTDPRHPWSRLTTAARTAPDDRSTTAPYGFATRLAALGLASDRAMSSLVERFALRALGVACLLALVSVAVNYSALNRTTSSDDEPAEDDPISLLATID